jgi:hypothetical protein
MGQQQQLGQVAIRSIEAFRASLPPGPTEGEHMDNNGPLNVQSPTLEDRIAEARARIAAANARSEALFEAKRVERDQKRLLERLQQEADMAEKRASDFEAIASKLIACLGDECSEVFVPMKTGQVHCEACLKKSQPAPVAIVAPPAPSQIFPQSSHRAPAFISPPKPQARKEEPCADATCGKLHFRDVGFMGPRSYCPDCRSNWKAGPKPKAATNTTVTAKPNAVSDNPKKIVKREVERLIEELINRDMPNPDWLTYQIEVQKEKTIVVATITNHPDLLDLPPFHHTFEKKESSSPSKR